MGRKLEDQSSWELLVALCLGFSEVVKWLIVHLLPRSFRAMWRDQYPAAPQWVISSMRDVIEDLVGHLSAF